MNEMESRCLAWSETRGRHGAPLSQGPFCEALFLLPDRVHSRLPGCRPAGLHYVEVASSWNGRGGEEVKPHWTRGAEQMLRQLIVPYYNYEKHLLPLVSLLILA